MDCSLPGFSLHGILQARVLEWVAIAFSRDLPNPGIKPGSLAFQADALTSEPPGKGKGFVKAIIHPRTATPVRLQQTLQLLFRSRDF